MNWTAWLSWSRDHQGPMLFLVFLILISDMIFALVAGLYLLKLRTNQPIITYFALLLLGIWMRGTCELMASIDGPRNIRYTEWFAWWYWCGRFLCWLPCVMLCKYILFTRRQVKD